MTTVKDILQFLETIAPAYMKESWDKIGLNCGRLDQPVTTVLVALDPFTHVCHEAKKAGAQLLLTHHALIWEPGFITDETETGRNTLYLIENHIAHINAHTNLDQAPGGVNDTLAEVLGLENIRLVTPSGLDTNGNPYGLLRQGTVPAQTLEQFLAHVKSVLGCPGLRYINSGRPVHRVAVGGGSCADFLQQVIDAGCDTFVTSDVKYNQFWEAKEAGIRLIDAGHFYTENPVCAVLVRKLQIAFPELTVKRSHTHTDCVNFFG